MCMPFLRVLLEAPKAKFFRLSRYPVVLQKSRSMSSAGPWLLGFFVFVLVGSGECMHASRACFAVHTFLPLPLAASRNYAEADEPVLLSQLSCR